MSYLKMIILSQLLIEANDELRNTQVYKHKVKSQLNNTVKMLESLYDSDYTKVYKNNPEMCTNVVNKVDILVNKIKGMTVDQFVILDAVIDKYLENKEWFGENTETEFLRLK